MVKLNMILCIFWVMVVGFMVLIRFWLVDLGKLISLVLWNLIRPWDSQFCLSSLDETWDSWEFLWEFWSHSHFDRSIEDPALAITTLIRWVVSSLEVLQIVLWWKVFCRSVGKHVLVCVPYITKGDIARSYGMLMCTFSRYYQAVFKVVLPIYLLKNSIRLPPIALYPGQ